MKHRPGQRSLRFPLHKRQSGRRRRNHNHHQQQQQQQLQQQQQQSFLDRTGPVFTHRTTRSHSTRTTNQPANKPGLSLTMHARTHARTYVAKSRFHRRLLRMVVRSRSRQRRNSSCTPAARNPGAPISASLQPRRHCRTFLRRPSRWCHWSCC